MILDVTHQAVNWNAQGQRFSAYLSDLNNTELSNKCWHHKPITVKNPNTGTEVTMTWLKDDKDGSNEDTYGFNYIGYNKGTRRHFTFLFINT
jgi:hypothetical protein